MTDLPQDYICFRLAEERYIHDVQFVREIMRYQQPTPVPGAPGVVEGILNVRGEVVCVLSGRRLLGIDDDINISDDWRIIILESAGGWLGISVDSVEEMVKVRVNGIDTLSQQPASPYITGTVQNQKELLIVTELVRPDLLPGQHH